MSFSFAIADCGPSVWTGDNQSRVNITAGPSQLDTIGADFALMQSYTSRSAARMSFASSFVYRLGVAQNTFPRYLNLALDGSGSSAGALKGIVVCAGGGAGRDGTGRI